METMVTQNWGNNKVHYGLCENGDLAYFILLGEWISKFDYMITYLVEDDAKTENGKMKNGNKKKNWKWRYW